MRVVFTHDVAAAGYECRLDDARWQPCSSPYTARGLRAGDHRVEIRAVMTDGRRGPVAARAFQVNPYPPKVTIAAGALRLRGGATTLAIGCSPREGEGRGRCRGTVTLQAGSGSGSGSGRAGGRGRRTVRLARASFTAQAGRSARVRLRLSPAGRRLLARAPRGRLAVRIVVDVRDLAGNRATVSVKRTLRAR